MTGGILQLSLWGSEDIVLSSQPQITWFKHVFRRSTPFSMDAVEQNFQGMADFGRRATVPLSRAGDLVTEVWLQVTLPSLADYYEPSAAPTSTKPVVKSARYTSSSAARIVVDPALTYAASRYTATLTPVGGGTTVTATSPADNTRVVTVTGLDAGKEYNVTVRDMSSAGEASDSAHVIALKWCNSVGHAMLESVELEIGGSRIDRHMGDWLDIQSQLTLPEEKKAGFHEMTGTYEAYDARDAAASFDAERTLFVPLRFFFNTSPGMALPIVALTYHETKLNFSFREYKECLRSTRHAVSTLLDAAGNPLTFKDIKLYATYVYLDVEERRRYASVPHEMLISQCQFLGDAAINVQPGDALQRKVPIEFSHPVKEIVWVFNRFDSYVGDTTTLDWFRYDEFFEDLKLSINGHDRTSVRPPGFYRLCQSYSHHTRCPTKPIYMYSYALHPENVQSSGSCNYSRVDTSHLVARLRSDVGQGRLRVFATSFNVLRISNGLGGLSFSGT